MPEKIACIASVSSGREANSFFRPRENRASAKKKKKKNCARPNVAQPEKEFASRLLETLAAQATEKMNLDYLKLLYCEFRKYEL